MLTEMELWLWLSYIMVRRYYWGENKHIFHTIKVDHIHEETSLQKWNLPQITDDIKRPIWVTESKIIKQSIE